MTTIELSGVVLNPYNELQPKQDDFLECGAKFKLMGGSSGGGKSYAFRAEAFRSSNIVDGTRGLVLRRSRPEVKKNFVERIQEETRVNGPDGTSSPYVRWLESQNVLRFPNGSKIDIGYCESEKDVERYRGLEYDWIGIEELTQWKEEWFRKVMTSLRSTRAGIRPFFFGNCNPGGIGHGWVKRLFISRQYLDNENPDDYAIIRANIWDNPALMNADPEYLQNLMNLPEKERRARLYGDWDVFEGQFFSEYREAIHTCEPFYPALGIKRRIIAIDYGYSNPSCVLWMALDTQGRVWVYRELYVTHHLYGALAKKIAALTRADEKIDTIVVDPAALDKANEVTGTSLREEFLTVARGLDVSWLANVNPANNNRKDGWSTVRKYLQVYVDPNEKREVALLQIGLNCSNLIRTLPDQVHDATNVEDMNTKGEDHPPDTLRYGLMELGISISSISDLKSANDSLKKSNFTDGMSQKEREFRERGISRSKSILDKRF